MATNLLLQSASGNSFSMNDQDIPKDIVTVQYTNDSVKFYNSSKGEYSPFFTHYTNVYLDGVVAGSVADIKTWVLANCYDASGGGGGGSATAGNQVIGNTSLAHLDTNLGAKADAAASSDTGTFSLISLFKRALQSLTTIGTNTTGVATAANQATGNASLATIATNTTGVSTAAGQTTGNTSLNSIDVNQGAMADAAASTDTGTFSLISLFKRSLQSLTTIGTNTTGISTSANQTTANTILAAIATNTTGASTAANQTTGNTSLNNIDVNQGAMADAAATTDTGTFSLISLFKRALQSLTSIGTNTTGLATAANQATEITSLSTIATNTTGASTAANQTTGNTSLNNLDVNLGAKADAAASTDIGTFSLISLFKRALQSLTTIGTNTTGLATAANQTTASGYLSTIATNSGTQATAANQATGNTSIGNVDTNLGAKADAAASTDTGTFSLISLFKRLLQTMTTINTGVIAATPAGENHIGEVGGNTAQIVNTLTVSTSAYVAGYVVGGKQTLTGALRISNGKGQLFSVMVMEKGVQQAPLTIMFFSQNPSNGTYTDHAALTMNATDWTYLTRVVKVATGDYTTVGTYSVADITAIGKDITGTDGTTSLYAIIITTGTPTFGTSGDVTLKVGLLRD